MGHIVGVEGQTIVGGGHRGSEERGAPARRHIGRALAAVTVAGWLAFAAGCSDDGDDSAPEASAGVPEETAADMAQTETATELSFTFTGDMTDAGCRYSGPERARTAITSTAVNESDGEVMISMARLAEGATYEDFLSHLDDLGESYPVAVPPQLHNPSANPWMQGEWMELHLLDAGSSQTIQREALFEGDYVAFCFRNNPEGDGSQLWPAGSLSVTD